MSSRKYAQQGYRGRKKKRDANEPEIVAALEAIPGVMVIPLDRPVDLLVGYNGINHLLEVKNPEGKNRLEPDQLEFIHDWPGREVVVVRTVDEALNAIGANVSSLAVARVPAG